MHINLRHLGTREQRVIVEAMLHDPPVLDDDRRVECRRQAEGNPAFDLGRDRIGIDYKAAVDTAVPL